MYNNKQIITIKEVVEDEVGKWRVVHHMVRLLEADKLSVGNIFAEMRREFGDVQVTWVEAVLKRERIAKLWSKFTHS